MKERINKGGGINMKERYTIEKKENEKKEGGISTRGRKKGRKMLQRSEKRDTGKRKR